MSNETKKTETAPTAVAVRENSTALAVGLKLTNVADIRAFAADVASSGIIGQITPTQAEVSLVAMRDEGLSIFGFKQKHQWVGNELSTKPNWMLGEFKRRGGKVHIVRADRECCEIVFTHWDGETLTGKITMDEMLKTTVPYGKDGKTLKANWKNFADDMLFARVCGKSLRRLCPELFCGMYTDDEAMDFDRVVVPVVKAPEAVAVPVAAASDGAQDYGVCPCGSVKGKPWGDIPTEKLEKILATPADKAAALTAEHRNAIVEELARREVAEQETAAEVVEAEVVEQ